MALYRDFIRREAIYRGAETGHALQLNPVDDLNTFIIKIYDRTGKQVQYLSNRVGRGEVLGLDFELLETGPGAFNMKTYARLANVLNDYRVEVYLWETKRTWYSGYLNAVPDTNQRQGPFEYTAQGFYGRLDNILVLDQTFTDTSVAKIIDGLLNAAAQRTGFDVAYNPNKVSPNVYNVPSVKFMGVTLKSALKQLGEVAKNHLVGVDEYRDVFFRPVSFRVNNQFIFVEGKDYVSAEVNDESGRVVNSVYVKVGKKQDDGTTQTNIMGPYADADSIALYGLHEKMADLPSAYAEDAPAAAMMTRWSVGYLKDNKDSRLTGEIKGVRQRWDIPLKPWGLCRLLQNDGSQVEAFVKKVKYNITNSCNIEVSLGWPDNTFVREFVDLTRQVEYNGALIEQNAQTDASGGSP